MSVLDISFTSQTHSPMRDVQHSLCEELQQTTGKQDIHNLDISKPETESQSEHDNSLISPTHDNNNKLQKEPEFDLVNKSIQSPEPNSQNNESQSEQQENESPKTITIIDELMSKQSFNASSKFTQYSTEVDNESFATFLSIRETSYIPVIKSFELLFNNVSNLFGERVQSITQSYLSLIRIKYNQQKSYMSVKISQMPNSRDLFLYMNFKTISEQILDKLYTQRNKHKVYVQSLQQIKSRLEKHIEDASTLIKEKRNKIIKIHNSLTQIANEMSDLMIGENRKGKKKQINPQLYSNSFLRTKYLIGKQKVYLSLIATYLERILNFITYICFQLEPKSCTVVKECLISYAQAINNFKPENKKKMQSKIQSLLKTNSSQQVYKEVAKLLELCVPQSISSHNFHTSNQSKQYNERCLKKIMEILISESQTLVYIPVIELEPKDFAYHSKNKANVKWIRVNYDQKLKQQKVQQFQTYVIITHEGHLILELLEGAKEREEKMAILKLGDIKISRKNNQLFLTEGKKGVIGYLVSTNAVLGSLTFQTLPGKSNQIVQTQNTLIEEFIQRVKDVLEERKEKKQSKSSNK